MRTIPLINRYYKNYQWKSYFLSKEYKCTNRSRVFLNIYAPTKVEPSPKKALPSLWFYNVQKTWLLNKAIRRVRIDLLWVVESIASYSTNLLHIKYTSFHTGKVVFNLISFCFTSPLFYILCLFLNTTTLPYMSLLLQPCGFSQKINLVDFPIIQKLSEQWEKGTFKSEWRSFNMHDRYNFIPISKPMLNVIPTF